tara:strand:+ start:548 stop:799 length:252 start_codon:yes stop_codon:yes gene_type:complete
VVKDIKVGDIVKSKSDGKLAIVTRIRENLECPTKSNPYLFWERWAELRWLDEDRHRRLGPVSAMPLSDLEVMSRKTRDDEDDS